MAKEKKSKKVPKVTEVVIPDSKKEKQYIELLDEEIEKVSLLEKEKESSYRDVGFLQAKVYLLTQRKIEIHSQLASIDQELRSSMEEVNKLVKVSLEKKDERNAYIKSLLDKAEVNAQDVEVSFTDKKLYY